MPMDLDMAEIVEFIPYIQSQDLQQDIADTYIQDAATQIPQGKAGEICRRQQALKHDCWFFVRNPPFIIWIW